MRYTLQEVEDAIRSSWGPDTCYEPYLWDEGPPSRGQCGTTALVLQDLIGGELLEAKVYRDGEPVEHHYWTRLPSGLEIDLTGDQFAEGLIVGEGTVRHRTVPLKGDHEAQYLALLGRVRAALAAGARDATKEAAMSSVRRRARCGIFAWRTSARA